MDNDTKNYLMQPIEMDNGLKIYPVKVFLNDEFSILFTRTILLSFDDLTKKLRQNFQQLQREYKIPKGEKFKMQYVDLWDYVSKNCIQYYTELQMLDFILKERKDLLEDESIQERINLFQRGELGMFLDSITRLIQICVNEQNYLSYCKNQEINKENEVTFEKDGFVIKQGEKIFTINKDNIEEFRDLIIFQNLVTVPLIGYDLRSQEVLDRAISKLNQGGKKSSIASMMSTVLSEFNYSDEKLMNLTQFRMKYDFNTATRKQNNLMFAMFKCVGDTKLEIESMEQEVDLRKNPYESLFAKEGERLSDSMKMNNQN